MPTRTSKSDTHKTLDYANHDSALCLAPGLFRSLPKGKRGEMCLCFDYQFNEKTLYRFSAPHALGVDDMSVLQGLLAWASVPKNRRSLTQASLGLRAAVLRENMNLEHGAKDAKIVSLDASVQNLARAIGYREPDAGNTYKVFRASVERLSKVSITAEHQEEGCEGYRLLSHYTSGSGKNPGVLSVALNPRLSDAVLGTKKVGSSYFRIDLVEVRKLKTDAVRLLHQRLQWLPPHGGVRPVMLNTLCGYVWPDRADAVAMRKRRFTIRKALEELQELGWIVSSDDGEKLEISRPLRDKPSKATSATTEDEDEDIAEDTTDDLSGEV